MKSIDVKNQMGSSPSVEASVRKLRKLDEELEQLDLQTLRENLIEFVLDWMVPGRHIVLSLDSSCEAPYLTLIILEKSKDRYVFGGQDGATFHRTCSDNPRFNRNNVLILGKNFYFSPISITRGRHVATARMHLDFYSYMTLYMQKLKQIEYLQGHRPKFVNDVMRTIVRRCKAGDRIGNITFIGPAVGSDESFWVRDGANNLRLGVITDVYDRQAERTASMFKSLQGFVDPGTNTTVIGYLFPDKDHA